MILKLMMLMMMMIVVVVVAMAVLTMEPTPPGRLVVLLVIVAPRTAKPGAKRLDAPEPLDVASHPARLVVRVPIRLARPPTCRHVVATSGP